MKTKLVIIGASGHGKVVADIAIQNGYSDIVFLDDNETLVECGGYPVVGISKCFEEFQYDTFIAIGNSKIRQRLQELLEANGRYIPVLVHPKATVAENVSLGIGTVVMAGAVINSGSSIGKGCIINTCSSVDHDCIVKDYAHISVGSHLAGTVTVGERTWIGIGAVVNNNLEIVSDCTIGAGAVIIKDIKKQGTYVGVPANKIK